jgi:hypothetical protein
MFLSQSRARTMQVHFQLATIKNGGSSITEYFQKYKHLIDSLAVAGQPLNDFELVSFLLAGLGSKYNPFVTSVTTRVDPLSLEDLYAHLLTHEMHLEHNLQSAEAPFPSANVAARSYAPKHKGTFRGPSGSMSNTHNSHFFNYNNGPHRGHGRGKGPSSHSPSGTSPKLVCQVCNKPGHTALSCYHWFDYSYQKDNSSTMQANIAAPQPINDLNWCPDTGATNRVTSDLANLNL